MAKKISVLVLVLLGLQLITASQTQAAYTPKAGDLIKVKGGNTVFLVDDVWQRIPLNAEAFAIRYNNQFSKVLELTEVEVGGKVDSWIINGEASHADGTIIKYWNDSTIYLLNGGFKHGFASWEAFTASGHNIADLELVGDYEVYPTGATIN